MDERIHHHGIPWPNYQALQWLFLGHIAYVTRYLIFQFFKKYVDAFANNILNGSETFLVDINLNNNCIKNVHTPTSNDDAVIKVFWETTYRKKSDDNQLLRFGSGNRWDSDGKTIYDQSRVQYDDEAVTLKQTKDITDKKIDMDNLLPQTLKSMLLIPDYDSNDNSDKHAVVNKKYVDSKTFTLVLI